VVGRSSEHKGGKEGGWLGLGSRRNMPFPQTGHGERGSPQEREKNKVPFPKRRAEETSPRNKSGLNQESVLTSVK